MADYAQMTDEQLIRRLRAGEEDITDYLMEKYKGMVRKEAKAMYLLGGENDDLIQEGMIGLFKAVRDYDAAQEASFGTFARLQRAGDIAKAKCPRSVDSRHAKSLTSVQGGGIVAANFGEQGGKTHLFHHVEGIVAGSPVGTEGDVQPFRQIGVHIGYAARQFKIAFGAMGDGRAAKSEASNLPVV